VACIFGAFSAFWLSLGVLVAAVTNGWFGLTATSAPLTDLPAVLADRVRDSDPGHGLRLPLAFSAAFIFVDIAVALVLINVLSGGGDSSRRWRVSPCSSFARSSPTSGSTRSAGISAAALWRWATRSSN